MSIPLEPAPAAKPPLRHALGLPAGSIRALLSLGVLGLLWAILLRYKYGDQPLDDDKLPAEFIYLQFLMVLTLAHFFASHGSSIGPRVSQRSPLGLPRGTVRLLLIAGYVGLSAFLFHQREKLAFQYPAQESFILLVGLLVSGFLLGHVINGIMRVLGRGQLPDWFVDFEAWIALLATFGLGVLVLVHGIINPSLPEGVKLQLPTWEASLAAIVGFYFGARS
jgi:hypothetical protein